MGNVSLQFLPENLEAAHLFKELSWRRFIQRVPDHYYAHFAAGVHCILLGKLDETATDYANSLRLNPRCVHARFNLAHVYQMQDKPDLAIRQYETLLEFEPGNPLAHSNLGRLLDQKQDPATAATHYRKAIENDPDLFEPHNRLGVILARQGDYAEAA